MDGPDGQFLAYERARREAMLRKGTLTPGEVAESYGLSAGFTRILISVVNDWPNNKSAFFLEMEAIYNDRDCDTAARAMAAEHASSCHAGEKRREWGMNAFMLLSRLGERDAHHLTATIMFGEWDLANKTITPDDVRHNLKLLIDEGGYNAPGRALWWASVLALQFESVPEARPEAIGFLEAVLARADQGEHSMNEYYLGKVRERLAELRA